MTQLLVRHLGVVPYQACWQMMQTFVNQRQPQTTDELWLLQHPAVFTLGQAGKASHILHHSEIPIIHADRGGQVTYHGPGQLIAYVLFDLKRLKLGIKRLVCGLEASLVALLKQHQIVANRREKMPGVYINEDKIASIGLRIRRGYSYHGISLNVNMDLSPFSQINPCGFERLNMTQLVEFCPNIRLSQVAEGLTDCICDEFAFSRGNTNEPPQSL